MSMCEKHVEAIGSPRANSPSWPRIDAMPKSEAEYTCAVGTGAKAKGACNEGESIYGHNKRSGRETGVGDEGEKAIICHITSWRELPRAA